MQGNDEKIRVLAWSDIGSSKFRQRKEFWALYEKTYPRGIGPHIAASLNRVDGIEATGLHGQGEALYHLDQFDVLMAWGHGGDAETGWEPAVDPAVRSGRLGLIPLHSIWNRHAWPNITELSGAVSGIGQVREDVPIRVEKCIGAHPILEGIAEFEVEDEIYFEPLELAADVTRLLVGRWEEHTSPFAWCRTVDQGRVVYIQPGHETNPSYSHPMMEKLLVNAAGRT